MNTGQELHKRSNQPANLSNTTHINSTTLAKKVSKVQKVIKKRFAAKLTTQKTCGDMPGSLCVLVIIQKSEKGVDPRTVKQMTGFKRKKVHKILYKLFKHGEIRIDAGGLYAGVKKYIPVSLRQEADISRMICFHPHGTVRLLETTNTYGVCQRVPLPDTP